MSALEMIHHIFDELDNQISERMLSPMEFDEWLKRCSQKLQLGSLGVQSTKIETLFEWGVCSGDVILDERGDKEYSLDVKVYADFSGSDIESRSTAANELGSRVFQAFKELWKGEYLKETGLTLQTGQATQALPVWLRQMPTSEYIAVVFFDLDNFKLINDEFGYDVGNKLLREVFRCTHELVRKIGGYSFLDGGDEFVLFLPNGSEEKIVIWLWELRENVRYVGTLIDEGVVLDLTLGMIVGRKQDICEDVTEFRNIAAKLTKLADDPKEKKRGTISFNSSSETYSCGIEKNITLEQLFKLGVCISKSQIGDIECSPFGDMKLNIISKLVSNTYKEEGKDTPLDQLVDDILQWLNIELDAADVSTAGLIEERPDNKVSKYALAISVLHGVATHKLLKGGESDLSNTLSIICGENGALGILDGDVHIFGERVRKEVINVVYGEICSIPDVPIKRGICIGIQIGFGEQLLLPSGSSFPQCVFNDVVSIDDRPRSGGGLPDFWQVALAQILDGYCQANGDVKLVFWGINPSSSFTYRHLLDIDGWPVDDLHILTGIPTDKIRELKLSIVDKVCVIADWSELLVEAYSSYQSTCFTVMRRELADEISPVIERPMVEVHSMGQENGFVCDTAAAAYPRAIDTVRKSQDVRAFEDDSGTKLKELIAFKLKLTNPLQDKIPFYLSKQKEQLENYYEDVLMKEDSLIKRELRPEDQIGIFITHLSNYISADGIRSTRRACLIVPNKLKDDQLQPLGLISVWATPRYKNKNHVYLDFIYVWRTVEAFIGLPYSLYGSICLAEDLTEKVKELVSNESPDISISVGELTYFALSLHLGGGKYHMRVAKHIVDQAGD